MTHPKNPLHEVLHQQVGIDSFALDGDDTLIVEAWDERERRPRRVLVR